ncbi:MAG: hypothetical protein JWL62_3626 [Hyphomicrobiales bacterium]|nr:hypothetical protein [Hyphomicrobiales bacterium]
MARRTPKRKTDLGTIVLHWTLVATLVVCALTGLRIAADAPDADTLRMLSAILPAENVWKLHIIAGVGLMMVALAYAIYMRMSGLTQRVKLDGARLSRFTSAPWSILNVLLHWLLFALIVTQVITGILLHRGFGGAIVELHLFATWMILLYVPAHLGSHVAYGGMEQLLRVIRPSAIAANASGAGPKPRIPNRARIAILTLLAGVAACISWFQADRMSRDVLTIAHVDVAPPVTGDLTHAAWRAATPLVVRTQQGGNLDEIGESNVEIRALHDGENAYFAFTWQDSTRSAAHFPLFKGNDGWHVLMYESQTRRAPMAPADEARRNSPVFEGAYAEDKFSVMLAASPKPFGPGAFHPSPKPLEDKPASSSGRGLHYTTDGSFVDAWMWHAALGSSAGRCEVDRIGGPQPANETQLAGLAPYHGGIVGDPAKAVISDNYRQLSNQSGAPVTPRRLPVNLASSAEISGPLPAASDQGVGENTRWAMTETESVPYTAAQDAAIPVGTVIPGLLIPKSAPLDSSDVLCAAHWAANRWTLTARRKLHTGNTASIPIQKGTSMFVAVFDHTAARHTRHIRPIKLEIAR